MLSAFTVTATDWVDVFFLFAVISAVIGFVLCLMKVPVNMTTFVFMALAFGFAGLLCA